MSLDLTLIYSEFNFNVLSDCENVVYLFDGYRLDLSRKMLYRDGEGLPLPPKAVETLAALLTRTGEIVTKDELISAIWTDTIVEESNLAHYLHVLRKALGNRRDGGSYIETLRRRGYRFNPVGEVTKEFPESNAALNKPERLNEPIREKFPAVGEVSYSPDSLENSEPQPAKRRKLRLTAVIAAALIFGTLFFVYYQKRPVAGKTPPGRINEMSVINLTDNSSIFSASISRDGKYFSYFEYENNKYHLYLQQTGKPTRLEIIPPSDELITAGTFSPDGEYIYFVLFRKDKTNGTLYRVQTLGGTVTEVLADISSPVSFSPDGSEIVFARYLEETREWALIISAIEGKNERVLLSRGGAKTLANGGAWSPDGKTIAFGEIDSESSAANNRYSLIGVEVRTGTTRELSREKWENCFRMDWTRDGAGLVFTGTRAGEGLSLHRDQVYYLSVADGESLRLTNEDSRFDSLSTTTTDDDAVIAVSVKRLSQIYKAQTNDPSNSSLRLTNGQTDGRGGIALLPDGRIGYTSRTGENVGIWTINADGTERTQIFDEFPLIEELRAAPGGKYFIFAAPRNGFSHLYRIDSNGANLKQITAGDSNEVDSSVSPDGNWVYYNSQFFEGRNLIIELRKIAIDGSRAVRLGENLGNYPHVSPDGNFLSLVQNENILIYSAADGKLVETIETIKPNDLHTGASWSPDGQALIYPAQDKTGVYNLWQHPRDGSAPRRLTRFSSGSIYNYAFSDDGNNLFLARGEQIRNAVLIKNFK